jgi:hypothetical protein
MLRDTEDNTQGVELLGRQPMSVRPPTRNPHVPKIGELDVGLQYKKSTVQECQ